MGCWCGFAPAPYISPSSRQVLARSVLPESVFGFAFGDYPDLDLAIFILALLVHWPLSFSSRALLSSLLNLSRCESASTHHIPGNQAVVVIARWNASGANTEAHTRTFPQSTLAVPVCRWSKAAGAD